MSGFSLKHLEWTPSLTPSTYVDFYLKKPNVVGISTRPSAGRSRNRGSVPGKGEGVSPSRLWSPPSLLSNGTGSSVTKQPRHEADHLLHQVPRLRMRGAVTPVPRISLSCGGGGQL